MKKVFNYLLLLVVCAFLANPVYAKTVAGCNLGKGVQIDSKLTDTVHLIVLIIQVAVPILLVIFGMIDLLKAVIAGKEDDIKKNQMIFVKRLIAGALVFFIFVVVKLVISLVADDSTNIIRCANCFINGSTSTSCKKAN